MLPLIQHHSHWISHGLDFVSLGTYTGGRGLQSDHGGVGSGVESGRGICVGKESGMESGKESGEVSGSDDGRSGDRGVSQGNGHVDDPHGGHPGYFPHCATGSASCRENGDGYGGVCWNDGDGVRHFLFYPSCVSASPWKFSPCVFLCWISCWGRGDGVWNGDACQCQWSGGSAPACFGMIGGVLLGFLCPMARCLWAVCSLAQRFVTLRLGWLRCCRGCRLQHNVTYRRGKGIKHAFRLVFSHQPC